MAKCALDGMAKQINEKYIPQLIEHDFNRLVGVILYGEVFKLPDNEYALGVVTGIFENDQEKNTFKIGQVNQTSNIYRSYFDKDELIQNLKKNDQMRNENKQQVNLNIADLIELHLNSTQVMPDGTVYKTKRYIATTGDFRIEVYPRDHEHQPHFHIISKQRGINARFDLETLKLMSVKHGKINPGDVKKIQNFFQTSPSVWQQLKDEHSRMK